MVVVAVMGRARSSTFFAEERRGRARRKGRTTEGRLNMFERGV